MNMAPAPSERRDSAPCAQRKKQDIVAGHQIDVSGGGTLRHIG
jgi:hypothetical protein